MIAALLLGCQSAEGPADPTGSGTTLPPEDPVPWVIPPTTTTAEDVDLDAVAATAQTALELVATIDPDPILQAYRELAAGMDSSCPAQYKSDDLYYWLDSCTSSAGTSFDGFGLDDALTVDDGSGNLLDVTATGGSGRIEDADGTFLDLDGYVQRIDSDADGITASTLVMTGEFATNHPAADGTWVGAGIRPNLTVTEYRIGSARALIAAVGAVDGLAGENPVVAFDDAAILDPSLGYGGCDLEPSGTVSVRLATGDWVDLVFEPVLHDDGSVTLADDADCDGCGEAWHRAEPMGRVCLDFSSWLGD